MPQPNAGLVEAPGDAGCPAGMARLGGFCIDRWEAALVEVTSNGERPWSPYFNPGSRRVRAVSIDGAVPQAYVSGQQAAGACAEAGKRLCSDAEWLSACRGSADRIYPYGDTRQPGVCNDSRSVHPAIDYFGTSDDSVFSMLDNACIGQQQETVDPAGANASCVTPEGVFDMMGNLHEWTSDPAGTFRGGFYVDTVRNGDGCLYRTTAHGFGYWDYSTGFRCCADAQ
jgi:formylglycine-generating enzyme required for sulfatase activity